MSETASQRPSPAVSALDRLVGHLEGVRARAANAFATEMFFFAEVADLVEQRERERAARAGDGATVETTQLGMREVYAEIATALNLSERQVASKVNSAYVMLNMFEETLYCVSEGRLSPTHAQLIADAGQVLEDPTVRSEYERLALNMADELTPAQLRAALPGVVTRLAPELAQDRIREAIARRRVTLRELEPGLSRITADVEALQGAGILSRLSEISTELEAENKAAAEEATATPEAAADEFVADERTRSQIMADVFCDLLLTSAVNGHGVDADDAKRLSTIQATVHVTIPASTLAGTTLGGAALVGGNAIDDDTAKQVVSSADVWVRLFTDPASGVPLTVDRYRPSSLQRLFLAARDEQCRFPGCRRPARKCDIDHTRAAADGGPTSLCNLAHLCERHHTLKHQSDWEVTQLPGGVLRWVAPTRRIHTTRPPAAVRFVPERDLQPAPF